MYFNYLYFNYFTTLRLTNNGQQTAKDRLSRHLNTRKLFRFICCIPVCCFQLMHTGG